MKTTLKKRIQQRGTLTIQDGQDLINKLAIEAQISQETRQSCT